ncbi:Maf family protein [Magnetofaba australis]|nr:Maf family protein [Magnetofaba australis]
MTKKRLSPWICAADDAPLRIRLASASPRRLELMRQMGLDPVAGGVDCDETPLPGETAPAYVLRLALEKARLGAQAGDADYCLGSDTSVVLAGEILGKPADADAALVMLTALAGRQHQVMTAVAWVRVADGAERSAVVTTDVWMRAATPAQLSAYIDSGEPMDKAGAYGIQGLGGYLVTRIEGSYTGVVGLPVAETLEMLSELMP